MRGTACLSKEQKNCYLVTMSRGPDGKPDLGVEKSDSETRIYEKATSESARGVLNGRARNETVFFCFGDKGNDRISAIKDYLMIKKMTPGLSAWNELLGSLGSL